MIKENREGVSYSLLLFGLAAVAWSLSTLLAIDTTTAMWFAIIITLLASMTSVLGLVHFWRHGPHKHFK
jgi:hypothetical protein